MQLARVKGTVVSTNKAEKLNGLKLQLIKPIDIETCRRRAAFSSPSTPSAQARGKS